MKIPTIPLSVKDWNIDKLNELIQYVGIESDTFDFKKEANQLEEHICAMANTKGGYLVLGIEEIKSKDGKQIIRFEKYGFNKGTEDKIKNRITNSVLEIEPTPNVDIIPIHEKDNKKFFMVIKIQNNFSDRPYFVQTTDQCYVRIHNSKIRANRSIIFNLFGASIEYRKNIQNLQSSCILLKESLAWTINYLEGISENDPTRPAPIDLTLLRASLLSAMEFVTENNLLGYRTKTTIHPGITTVIDTIEQLNAQIHVYNTTENLQVKKDAKLIILGYDRVLAHDIRQTPKLLDTIISKTSDFLSQTG